MPNGTLLILLNRGEYGNDYYIPVRAHVVRRRILLRIETHFITVVHAAKRARSNERSGNRVKKQIRLLLGDGMIDIELDPEHYDLALDIALGVVVDGA